MSITRLWHKDLLPYLPDSHLTALVEKVAGIMKKIQCNELVDIVTVDKYEITHAISYYWAVHNEVYRRGTKDADYEEVDLIIPVEEIFGSDMGVDYLIIDRVLLEDDYMNGRITKDEWDKINRYTYNLVHG